MPLACSSGSVFSIAISPRRSLALALSLRLPLFIWRGAAPGTGTWPTEVSNFWIILSSSLAWAPITFSPTGPWPPTPVSYPFCTWYEVLSAGRAGGRPHGVVSPKHQRFGLVLQLGSCPSLGGAIQICDSTRAKLATLPFPSATPMSGFPPAISGRRPFVRTTPLYPGGDHP